MTKQNVVLDPKSGITVTIAMAMSKPSSILTMAAQKPPAAPNGCITISRKKRVSNIEINGEERINSWLDSMKASSPTHVKATPLADHDPSFFIVSIFLFWKCPLRMIYCKVFLIKNWYKLMKWPKIVLKWGLGSNVIPRVLHQVQFIQILHTFFFTFHPFFLLLLFTFLNIFLNFFKLMVEIESCFFQLWISTIHYYCIRCNTLISIPNYKDELPQKMSVIAWIDKIDKSILL